MKRITKKQAKERTAAWRLAVSEGRVVRYGDPKDAEVRFEAYATPAEALAVVLDAADPKIQIVVKL